KRARVCLLGHTIANMSSMTVSPRLQAKEIARREQQAEHQKNRSQSGRRKKRTAQSPPPAEEEAAAKRPRTSTPKARPPAPSKAGSIRDARPAKQLDGEMPPEGNKKVGSKKGGGNRTPGRAKTNSSSPRRGGEQRGGGGGGGPEQRERKGRSRGKPATRGKRAQVSERAASTGARKVAAKKASMPSPPAGQGNGSSSSSSSSKRRGAAPHKGKLPPQSNLGKAFGKGPSAKQRKLFKLSKSLLPLGIWPSSGESEAFDIAPEWKASLLKRYENPPPYRKLKANLYEDSSLKGLVPVDEIPLCNCRPEDGCDANCINRLLLMECAPGRCPTLRGASKHCNNNAIQTKTFPATEVFRTFEGRGWGLRLAEERGAEAGTLLHEYLGEVIMMDECRRRLRKVGRKGVEGSSGDFYFASLDGNLVLDGGPMGNEARFANHSCSPNCLMQKWSVLGETRVVLVAARDISFGEELTYNYQADTLEGFVERQKCLCGEPQCSGFIGGELVAVKAEEWQRRASKVMNQAKPQLEVVRELFHEGRELGYELSDEGGGEGGAGDGGGANSTSAAGSGPMRYQGREMECLSIMLREGDEWLEELARVMGGTTIAAAAAAAASSRKNGTGAVGVEETAVQPPPAAGELPRRRASTRAGRGERKPRDAYDDDDGGGGKVGEGEESNPDAPRVVDLVQLEKVVQTAPTGLQITEAVKAKKTVARASHVAQTVWALLDAASKNGLKGVRVPVERQPPPLTRPQPPQLATSDAASGGACPSVPAAACSSSKSGIVGRSAEKDKSRRGGQGAVGGGRGRRGRYGSEGDYDAMMPEASGGGSGTTDAAASAGAKSNDDATMEVRGDGSSSSSSSSSSDEPNGGEGGQQLVPLEGRCGSRDDEAEPATDAGTPGGGTDDSPVVANGASGGSGGGGSSPDCGEELTATVISTAAVSRADGDNNGNLERGAFKPAVGLSPRVVVATRSGGKRKPSAALSFAGVAERKRLVPPAATSTTSSLADGSPALPPKPKMSQVCQAIRSCRGLAHVFIPGASELEKLVAPAEAWAKEACDMLKIKVLDPSVDDPATGGAAAAGGKVKNCDRDRDGEKEIGKWARLGLKGPAMTALEEKLQDVAEFSLAREQREEEVEKERLQREKEDARERERQARMEKLARLKALSKRRNAPRGVGGVSTNTAERGGGAAGDAVGGGSAVGASREAAVRAREARRSPRIVSLGSSGAPSTADPATAQKEEEEGEGIGDAEEAGWTKEDEEALHCLCRLPADAARFRTLMTCDLCSSWFHPSCVRLKELPKRSLREDRHHRAPALAFVCPMCEHRRGGVSNFACPPSSGFYIGRRMHRPGLLELETLMRHADSLPVDGVDGQAYLNYMVDQVVGWRDRCEDAVKEFQAYIQGGDTTGVTAMRERTPPPPAPSAGLVLASAGRRLGFEASLVERLGRLVCEGALIEVVDVHKEDTMLRRALWTLTASLCFPKATSCLRLGQEPG
ncbi:unnamed protein product, partial [Ectocarpus sp. 4 AP-2014]